MENKVNQSIEVATASDSETQQARKPLQEAASRRRLIGSLGAFSALLLQACADSLFSAKSQKTNSRATDNEEDDLEEKDREGKQKPLQDPSEVVKPAGKCHPTKITSLDGAYDETPTELRPQAVFYGQKSGTSMIAYRFTTDKPIESVTLLASVSPTSTRKILAYQLLSSADLAEEGGSHNYTPMLVDNLYLSAFNHIYMVLKSEGKLYSHQIPISYLTTFNDTPVVDYSVPSQIVEFNDVNGINIRQSVANFKEDAGFFKNDQVSFPLLTSNPNDPSTGAKGGRSLMTAIVDSEWTPVTEAGRLIGTITDILGEVIDVANDKKFLLKYQTFCAYVPDDVSAPTVYYRTMMKVG